MVGLVLGSFLSQAQQSLIIQDPYLYQQYKDARQWFDAEQYKLAYPVFKSLEMALNNEQLISQELYVEELKFYKLACELTENNPSAEPAAKAFMASTAANITKAQLAFYLGSYYFRQQNYAAALEAFEKASVSNLNNNQVATLQFQHGYSLFTQKQFARAKPLFQSVRQSATSPYYIESNYYYGLIAFGDRNYKEALAAFEVVKSDSRYAPIVPYYTASINYSLGQKDKALQQAESAINQKNLYYKNELLQLLGHGYFEKGEYKKAAPYLEQYIKGADKVKREQLYQLAYCYYIDKKYTQAIEQFKPLAGGADSLSQHAMYLLGDAYLKTNQKANARNAFLFCSSNSSHPIYKQISLFHYAKLSYELGFDKDALLALKQYLSDYKQGTYVVEAKDLLVAVLANTSNYKEALELYESLPTKTELAQRQFPKIAYNRAQELLNDRNKEASEKLLKQTIAAKYNEQVASLAHFWLGEIEYGKANYATAVQHFEAYLAKPIQSGEANTHNAQYNLGYSLLRLQEYKQAAAIFKQLDDNKIGSAQQQTDISLRLADANFMQKEFGKAGPIYTSVAARRGTGADYALFQNGIIAGAQNKPSEKITLLRSIETLYPGSALIGQANMEIADTYLADEKFREAIPYLARITSSKTNESLKPTAYLKTGLAHNNLGNNNEALAAFKTILKQFPQSEACEEAIDNARSIYIEMGKPDLYVALLNEVGRSIENNVADSITYAAAEIKWNEGNKEAAFTGFTNYLTKYPEGRYAVEANFFAGEIKREKKELKEAAAFYGIVAGKAPNKFAEKALLYVSRMQYFDFKDYAAATKNYQQLKLYATNADTKLEAMRGLVRSQYYNGDFDNAVANAKELLQTSSAGSDDKIFANLLLGKQAMGVQNCAEAINYFKAVAALSKAETGAEARYHIAACLLSQNKLGDAEKAAFEVIQKSGSYEFWVTKSYLLLGDVFLKQKDYFNAKATFKSVSENAAIPELKKEALEKLALAEAAAAAAAKMEGGQQK